MNKVSGRNKIKLVIVLVCLITLLGIGFSYAYWRFTGVQTNKNVAVSKCLELSMDNQKDELNLTNIYPISDEEGRSLKPYTFTLTNTCTMSAEYSINLEMLEGTTMNSKYLATLVNNGDINLLSSYDTTKTIISGSIESRVLDTGILTPGAFKEYSISLWMDKSITLADDVKNKNFKAKVIVDASVSTGIIDKIVSQLDTTGKCPTVNDDGTVNVTSAESENSLLCSALDNYGTSYYYRGNVQNNYVKFANFYWRIVRINGDGSIRMIYDGTVAHVNGEENKDRVIGKSVFTSENRDNADEGYMYGTPGSSTYEETHANINDSTIKKYIDTWYESNLKFYSNYLADNIFCNDRKINNTIPDGYTNKGYQDQLTIYNWYYAPWEKNGKKLNLQCPQQNDAFTVNDISKGNGALTYPIALITSVEAALVGGWSSNNINYYLRDGSAYWTLTPRGYTNDWATGWAVNQMGHVFAWDALWNSQSVKPVINLKSNSLKFGDGTMNNPYTLE